MGTGSVKEALLLGEADILRFGEVGREEEKE
jgi:hypothetical protein